MVVHAPLDRVNHQIYIKQLHTSHTFFGSFVPHPTHSTPLHSLFALFCINTQTLCQLTRTLCFSVTTKKPVICYDLKRS